MRIHALAIITALALPTLAMADDKTPGANPSDKTTDKASKLSEGDVAIIAHLHHVNLMEIDVGKAAQKRGTTSVKSYSDTLVSDHRSVDKDLTSFAKKRGLSTIPADKPQTEADKQEQKTMADQVARLKSLKGAEFDREFLNMMVSGHEKEIARVDAALSTTNDPDLRTMLTSVKSMLQRHAEDARNLQKNLQASTAQPQEPPSSR